MQKPAKPYAITGFRNNEDHLERVLGAGTGTESHPISPFQQRRYIFKTTTYPQKYPHCSYPRLLSPPDSRKNTNTYSKVAMAKLYTTKMPITAAYLLTDRVLPFFDEHATG